MYRVGQIVIVEALLDPQGKNPKDRHCVVVLATALTDPDRQYGVVGITTTLQGGLAADQIALPRQRPRHPRTGLNKPNAVLCTWSVLVDEGQIIRRIGDTPPARLIEIAEALARLAGPPGP